MQKPIKLCNTYYISLYVYQIDTDTLFPVAVGGNKPSPTDAQSKQFSQVTNVMHSVMPLSYEKFLNDDRITYKL